MKRLLKSALASLFVLMTLFSAREVLADGATPLIVGVGCRGLVGCPTGFVCDQDSGQCVSRDLRVKPAWWNLRHRAKSSPQAPAVDVLIGIGTNPSGAVGTVALPPFLLRLPEQFESIKAVSIQNLQDLSMTGGEDVKIGSDGAGRVVTTFSRNFLAQRGITFSPSDSDGNVMVDIHMKVPAELLNQSGIILNADGGASAVFGGGKMVTIFKNDSYTFIDLGPLLGPLVGTRFVILP
jgi:hypothetical protein